MTAPDPGWVPTRPADLCATAGHTTETILRGTRLDPDGHCTRCGVQLWCDCGDQLDPDAPHWDPDDGRSRCANCCTECNCPILLEESL